MRTIRGRTTLVVTCVVGLALIVASLLFVTLRDRSLVNDVDARARARLLDVVALATKGQVPARLATSDDDGTAAQIVADGRVVAQSPQVRGDAPLAGFVPSSRGVTVRTVARPPIIGGGSHRVAAKRVTTPEGAAIVYVAASLEPVRESMHAVEVLLLVAVPALILLIAALTWWLVGRTLRPVEIIRRRVDDISASDLDQRVPEPETGDEVQRLAETMNSMLARLESASLSQRAFVSDAAHELRSPLATMHAELDIARAHPESTDVAPLLARLTDTTKRMERLVEDLLVLATADELGVHRRTVVDLDEVVLQRLESLRLTSSLAVQATRLDAARVSGDPDQLQRVVANLLDNAESHASSTIAVELRLDGETAELAVSDDGAGVPPDMRERVFDRFARADESRTREAGGAGLGLAIARRIVEDHGGSIAIADVDVGTRVVVRLPRFADTDRSSLVDA